MGLVILLLVVSAVAARIDFFKNDKAETEVTESAYDNSGTKSQAEKKKETTAETKTATKSTENSDTTKAETTETASKPETVEPQSGIEERTTEAVEIPEETTEESSVTASDTTETSPIEEENTETQTEEKRDKTTETPVEEESQSTTTPETEERIEYDDTSVEKEEVSTSEEAEETESAEAVDTEDNPWRESIEYYGYSLSVEAYKDRAYVTYPSFITKTEVLEACAAAYEKYPEYLGKIGVNVLGNGRVELTYPETVTPEDLSAALDIIEEELPLYVESVLNEPQNKDEAAVEENETAAIKNETEAASTEVEPVMTETVTPEESRASVEEKVSAETKADNPDKTSPLKIENKPEETSIKTEAKKSSSEKRQSVAVWGTPYGLAEKIENGKTFNIKRLTRSYIYGFNIEYDYRLSKLFTIGVKTGYEGVIFHVGGYTSQIPFLLTVGMVPYEREHSKLAFDLGVGVDIPGSISSSSFALQGDFALTYSCKFGESFSLGVGTGLRLGYIFSTKEVRLEIEPVIFGAAFTF